MHLAFDPVLESAGCCSTMKNTLCYIPYGLAAQVKAVLTVCVSNPRLQNKLSCNIMQPVGTSAGFSETGRACVCVFFPLRWYWTFTLVAPAWVIGSTPQPNEKQYMRLFFPMSCLLFQKKSLHFSCQAGEAQEAEQRQSYSLGFKELSESQSNPVNHYTYERRSTPIFILQQTH